MKLWPFRSTEHRATDLSSTVVEVLLASATGAGAPAATATAAVQAAVRVVSSPFATAFPSVFAAVLTPARLLSMARGVLLTGSWVGVLDIDDDGRLAILSTSAHEVAGRPNRWVYDVEMRSPSGGVEKRRVPQEGIVHLRIGASEAEPWKGIAPWRAASLTSTTLSSIERSLQWDAKLATGALLVIPDGAADTQAAKVSKTVREGVGAISSLETTRAGFGQGAAAAPHSDYDMKRFGPQILAPNVDLRDSTTLSILSVYGVHHGLLGGDGASLREARHSLYLDTIIPMAAVFTAELSQKLESVVTLDFAPSEYADWQRLSRATKSLVDAGFSLDQVAAMLGLNAMPAAPQPTARDATQRNGHNPYSAPFLGGG